MKLASTSIGLLDLTDNDTLGGLPFAPLIAGAARASRFTGIHALMAAVLEEAIRNYRCGSRAMQVEVATWLASMRRDSPFTFLSICEQLGLDAEAVRGAVARRPPIALTSPRHGTRVRGNVRPTRELI